MMIKISEHFSRHPAGRFFEDGPDNGSRFRDEILVPALESGEIVEVRIDGTSTLPTSFLEEGFGGLIRRGFPLEKLKEQLRITSEDVERKSFVDQIWNYIRNEAALT